MEYIAMFSQTETAKSGANAAAAVLTGVIAMVLIYIVTANLQKIAAAADRLLGRKPDDSAASGTEPIPERVEDNYKVYDIYEGEINLGDNDKKEL